MFVQLSLILGVLLAVTGLATPLPTVIPFCFEGDCYVKPENTGKSWQDAQQMCRKHNSTLPIVDKADRQKSFVAALNNFSLHGADVWLGAKASDYGSENWRWLDGSHYSGNAVVVQDTGTYDKSYAFLSKKSSEVLAYASGPRDSYFYICQYNTIADDICTNGTGRLAFVKESRCYVKYDDKLFWFNARNNCLKNNGELASFSNISVLDWIVDSNGSWVGLRHSQWIWHNAVTGLSSDVTFTSWSIDQPDDATPTCISINYGDFPNWKDWNCSKLPQCICQVLNITSTVSTQETPSSELSTPSSTTKNVPIEMPGSAGSESQNKVNVPLAIGLGVGIGSGLIAVIIIALTVIIVRKKHRNRESSENSKSKEKFQNQNGRISPEEEATEMDEISHGSKPPLHEASPNYATVQETTDFQSNSKHAAEASQPQLDDTLPKYGIVKKARDIDPISQDATSSNRQSQLDDASPNYATVHETTDLEPNSKHAAEASQSHLDDTLLRYGIVQKAKDIDPVSQLTASSISQSQLDDTSPNYATVQETNDLEQNAQHADDSSQSQLEDTLTNYATVQKVSDLEPVAQDTTSCNSQSQLHDAWPNYAMVQEANDLEQHTANTNESQFDDNSPTYATVQEGEGLTQDSKLPVNQNPIYADLDFCREAF